MWEFVTWCFCIWGHWEPWRYKNRKDLTAGGLKGWNICLRLLPPPKSLQWMCLFVMGEMTWFNVESVALSDKPTDNYQQILQSPMAPRGIFTSLNIQLNCLSSLSPIYSSCFQQNNSNKPAVPDLPAPNNTFPWAAGESHWSPCLAATEQSLQEMLPYQFLRWYCASVAYTVAWLVTCSTTVLFFSSFLAGRAGISLSEEICSGLRDYLLL